MAICGAKKRNGEACQKPPLKGKKRCRLHGGNAGAPRGSQNNKKVGSIYSRFFTKEENQIAENLDLSSIDDELKLTKIMLQRALKLAQEQEYTAVDDRLDLEVITESPPLLGGIPDYDVMVTQKTFKKRDYAALIDRLTARIQTLTRQRNELITQSLSNEKLRLELDEIKKEVDGVKDKEVTIKIVRVGRDGD